MTDEIMHNPAPAGVVCPFHPAVINHENANRAGAPTPGRVGKRNRLTVLYRHARFHAGFGPPTAFVAMIIGILGGKQWTGVLRNALTWSYDPAELADSPLNKHPQNSGMVSRSPWGGFAEDRLERLLDNFGSIYSPFNGEASERGVSRSELDVFLDMVAAEHTVSSRRRRIGRRLANAELPVALDAWGTQSNADEKYLSETAIRDLYGNHRFPNRPKTP